jgi:hypothetical protein
MNTIRWMLAGLVLAFATGCPTNSLLDGGNPPVETPDANEVPIPDAGEDAGVDFATFVIDQINNNTKPTSQPEDIEKLNFINVDSPAAGTFQSLFP